MAYVCNLQADVERTTGSFYSPFTGLMSEFIKRFSGQLPREKSGFMGGSDERSCNHDAFHASEGGLVVSHGGHSEEFPCNFALSNMK